MKPGHILSLAAVNGLAVTALSALGNHAFASMMDTDGQTWFQQATNFHAFHAVAILGAVLAGIMGQQRAGTQAALLFQLGIVFFSGTLYWRALLGPGSLGGFHWLTPLGGLLLLAGWLMLVLVGMKAARNQPLTSP